MRIHRVTTGWLISILALTAAMLAVGFAQPDPRVSPQEVSDLPTPHSYTGPALSTVWGPVEVVRDKGKPLTIARAIPLHLTAGPYILRLRNGDAQGGRRVSSARVWIGGQLAFGPSDFSQAASEMDALVSLTGDPMLEVQVEGGPAGVLTISLAGRTAVRLPHEFIVISPQGGEYVLANGTRVVVPPGAVVAPTTIGLALAERLLVEPLFQVEQAGSKYFIAAFDALPSGLRFLQPLEITLPAARPVKDSIDLPLYFNVDLERGMFSAEDATITYDPRRRSVMVTVTHFTTGAVMAEDDALMQEIADWGIQRCEELKQEDPCRCGRFRINDRSEDFARGDGGWSEGCWLSIRFATIEYLDCGTAPEVLFNHEEALRMLIDVSPMQSTISVGDEASLTASVTDVSGHRYNVPLQWTSTRPEVARVPNSAVGVVRGVSAGWTNVWATDECSSTGSAVVTVEDVAVAGIQLSPPTALLRNNGTELPLMWQFVSADGTPVAPPNGVSATWAVDRPGILTTEQQDLQHAVLRGVAPGRATVTVRVTYSGRTFEDTARIDVFEEGIYRFSSSSITTTGESRGQVWECDNSFEPPRCAWASFSCTFRSDSIFDPASAARVVTRPVNDGNNYTAVVLDGGLDGGSPLRVTVSEVVHELSRQGPACLAPTYSQSTVVPFATRVTPFGGPIYPFSGMGLVWDSGVSHGASWIGGFEGDPASGTAVRFSWPVDVTYESLVVRTERSWNSFLPGSSSRYQNLSWSSQVSGEFRLVRER